MQALPLKVLCDPMWEQQALLVYVPQTIANGSVMTIIRGEGKVDKKFDWNVRSEENEP